MSASEVRATYEELSTVARRFVQASEKHQQDLQRVQQASTRLHHQGWEGKGSDAFFQEMERVVLPAMRRLCTALAQGGTTVQKIQTVMRNAEEEAARLFQGQAGNGGSQSNGSGGGDGVGLTANDVASDEVTASPIQNLGDAFSVITTAIIAQLFGVNLAFPTNATDDMPRFPGDSAPDPSKPELRTATAEDGATIAQVYNELNTLKEYGVTLTQNDGAHWTPQEIHQIYVAVTEQAQATYDRAVQLGLIDPTKVTPADVFQAVYTDGEHGISFIRDADNKHSTGAYAWKSGNTFTLFDAAYYAQQTTGKGAASGLHFTPSLLLQHEISHQINQLFPTVMNGDSPSAYYSEQFPYVDGILQYTFRNDHAILYQDANGQYHSEVIPAGTTVTANQYATGVSYSSDAGYDFRTRTFVEGDDGYNSEEAVTDAMLAESLGLQGGYTPLFTSRGDEVWRLARDEVNTYIFDTVLQSVDWSEVGD